MFTFFAFDVVDAGRHTVTVYGRTKKSEGGVSVVLTLVDVRRVIYVRPRYEENKDAANEAEKEVVSALREAGATNIKVDVHRLARWYAFGTHVPRGEGQFLVFTFSPCARESDRPVPLACIPATGKHYYGYADPYDSLSHRFVHEVGLRGVGWIEIRPTSMKKGEKRMDIECVVGGRHLQDIVTCIVDTYEAEVPPLTVAAIFVMTDGKDAAMAVGQIDIGARQQSSSPNNVERFSSLRTLAEKLGEDVDPDVVICHGLGSESCPVRAMCDELSEDRTVDVRATFGRRSTGCAKRVTKRDALTRTAASIRSTFSGRMFCDTVVACTELWGKHDDAIRSLEPRDVYGRLLNKDAPLRDDEGDVWMRADTNAAAVFEIALFLGAISLAADTSAITGLPLGKSLQFHKHAHVDALLSTRFLDKGCIFPHPSCRTTNNTITTHQGGLVLKVNPALYDDPSVLVDFKSLYPSIIREENICFSSTKDDGRGKLYVHDNTIDGVIPCAVWSLVMARRECSSTDERKQRALKIVSNSMYGCLDYRGSRFYEPRLGSMIAESGRKTLSKAIECCSMYTIAFGDTDSVCVVLPPNLDVDAQREAGQKLAESMSIDKKYMCAAVCSIFSSIAVLASKAWVGVSPTSKTLDIHGIDIIKKDKCRFVGMACEAILRLTLIDKKHRGPALRSAVLAVVGAARIELSDIVNRRGVYERSSGIPLRTTVDSRKARSGALASDCPQNVYNVAPLTFEDFVIAQNVADKKKRTSTTSNNNNKQTTMHRTALVELKRKGRKDPAGNILGIVVCNANRTCLDIESIQPSIDTPCVEYYLEKQFIPSILRITASILPSFTETDVRRTLGLDVGGLVETIDDIEQKLTVSCCQCADVHMELFDGAACLRCGHVINMCCIDAAFGQEYLDAAVVCSTGESRCTACTRIVEDDDDRRLFLGDAIKCSCGGWLWSPSTISMIEADVCGKLRILDAKKRSTKTIDRTQERASKLLEDIEQKIVHLKNRTIDVAQTTQWFIT